VLRLALIFGGRSVEHEVSVVSAQHVIAAVDRDRFQVVPIGVTREGIWLSPEETQAQLVRPEAPFRKRLHSTGAGGTRGVDLSYLDGVDVVFPLVHGAGGEDGTLQGLLEILGLPYVGCGVAASALGMDKALMKAAFSAAGLPVGDYRVVRAPADERATATLARDLDEELGLPLFVKPASGGSSIGISKASGREDLALAIAEASRHDRKLVIEKTIVGREVECGVLGNEDAQASPIGEISFRREFYDFEAKYLDPETRILAPADVPAEVARRIQELSLGAFRAIDGSGLSRVDFFLCPDGSIFIDEINTMPGFTPASMFPTLWEKAGISYSDLISRLVEFALTRYKERPVA
jgi:D-alanine-D-alanine ligase